MKEAYMKQLEKALEGFGEETRKEILEDYEQHFAEGLAEGRTEEEIIRELGSIEEMIADLPEEERPAAAGKTMLEAAFGPGDEAAPSGGERVIEISTEISDIHAAASEDGRIRVDYKNPDPSRYEFFQSDEGGVFRAGERTKSGSPRAFFSFLLRSIGSEKAVLTVRIPRGVKAVKLRTAAGDVTLEGVRCEELDVDTTAGDVCLGGCAAETMEIGSVSGDVEFRGVTCANGTVKATSGDLGADGLRAGNVTFRSRSGDVELKGLDAGGVRAESASGDVEIKGSVLRAEVKTVSGDVELEADASLETADLHAVSGDVDVELDAAAGASILAKTGSGDFLIRNAEYRRDEYGSFLLGAAKAKIAVRTSSGDVTVRAK